MKPDDLITSGFIGESDLDGPPPAEVRAELGPLGRYLLIEEMGRGGSAFVFRALDPLLNRELALKRLRFGDLELETRFMREAELMARLSHPGIVPVFDFGQEGESFYYTMPIASGLSLDRWLAGGKRDPRESARIMKLAAEAIAYAHGQGVLHRDIKPANILLNAAGDPLVADFGLGRFDAPAEDAEPRMTESGAVMGTPSYMAPEFASGDLKSVDARCDVYALGATLYESLTGRPPFMGNTSLEILKRVVSEDATPPRRLAPGTPRDLEIICQKAMEKKPERRYATASELADDLGRFLKGEAIHARPPDALYRLNRYLSRRKAAVVVSLALFTVVAVLATVWIAGSMADARRRRVESHLVVTRQHVNAIDLLLATLSEADPKVLEQAAAATRSVDQALAEDPWHAEAWYLRGRICALLFEKAEARRCYDEAVRHGPHGHASLERALLDMHDLAQAAVLANSPYGTPSQPGRAEELRISIEKDLALASSLTDELTERKFAASLLELSRGTPEGGRAAAIQLEEYAKMRPDDLRHHYWRAVAEFQVNEFKKAEASLRAAIHWRPKTRFSAQLRDWLAVVLFLQGQEEEAVTLWEEAINLDPSESRLRINLGAGLLQLDRTSQVIALMDEVLTKFPELAPAHALRGLALSTDHARGRTREKGVLEEARRSLRIARRGIDPDTDAGRVIANALEYADKQLPAPKEY